MSPLAQLVAEELAQTVDPRVRNMAEALAAKYPGASKAVLFYGSCLRESQLDGLMLDFYLIVSDYEAAYGKGWLARANALIPPNVFPFEHDGLMAKYAVLSEADFRYLNSVGASTVSVWARFAQPSRLVWQFDEAARSGAILSVIEASVTLFQLTLPMMPSGVDHGLEALWQKGFELTYGAELRAERSDRPRSVIEFDPERYSTFGQATLTEIEMRMGVGPNGEVPNNLSPASAAKRWLSLRRRGKLLTIGRLAKAAFTYSGGIDYLAWKINRHAGTRIEIKPWQRKWPLVAAFVLVPKLLAKGAVR